MSIDISIQLTILKESRPPKVTTEETYKNNVTAHGIPVDVEQFDGFSLAWIGSRNAKQMVLYSCGGGFCMHAYDAHIAAQINGYKAMKANGQDVAIAILCYGKSKSQWLV